MKKVVLFVLALVLLSAITNAGEPDKLLMKKRANPAENGGSFDSKTHLINIGLGFGGAGYYSRGWGSGYSYASSPVFSISYEQAYPKKLGPGYLGVGAYAGYRTSHSRYDDYYYAGTQYYYEHRWNYMMFAARGVYHWDVLNFEKADIYGGVLIGFKVTTYSYASNSTDPDINKFKRSDSGFTPAGSAFAGARWYFAKNFAVFGEAGYGISYLTGGLTFKW